MEQKVPQNIVEVCPSGNTVEAVLPGDFFLVHGENFFSRLIQFGQALRFRGKEKHFSYWTHCGVFTSLTGDIIEALGNGVIQNNISYYKDYKYIVVHISALPDDREEMIQFAKACLGDKYGWLTLLSIAISLLSGTKFSFNFDGQEICSGLVTRSLERTTFIPKRDASHMMPADLAQAFGVL